MVSRSSACLALLFLAAASVSFCSAEAENKDVKVEKEGETVEPMSYFHKKDPFHKKDFFHKKDPFHKHPVVEIKKHPLPPIPIVVIKKHPLPPVTIPVIKKKPYYHPHPFPVIKKKPITIPIPNPVYVHPSIPKPVYVHPSIPKKPCPPIYKKPLFPPHANLP